MAIKTAIDAPVATIGDDLAQLYAENITAKIYRTAVQTLIAQVPQSGEGANLWALREADFWTAGFFPGTLWSLLERYVKFPKSANITQQDLTVARVREDLQALCKLWSEPLHEMANRKDTHDVGFLIMPALKKSWEMTGDTRSLDSIIRAAYSLASRYIPAARAIRSWDEHSNQHTDYIDQTENALIIIDSMCNLDLIYYAASHLSREEGSKLCDIATTHADTVLQTNLRPETVSKAETLPEVAYRGQWYSTCHVANLDPKTGQLKARITAQGFADESTWTRGQAWAIMGYAETYMWTKDKRYLDAACGLAEYFLHRMDTGAPEVEVLAANGASTRHRRGRYVPLWDFDAPIDNPSFPLRDSSAGSIAANGMLIISQALLALGDDKLASRFRTAAIDVVRDLIAVAVAPETAKLVLSKDGDINAEDSVSGQTFEGIMKYGTVNNHQYGTHQYKDSAIVYGDYYLVEFGNRLLRLELD
ncbi:Six-hairpin glycosidase [Sarocladium strictum]